MASSSLNRRNFGIVLLSATLATVTGLGRARAERDRILIRDGWILLESDLK